MKKILGILVISLLLITNANASCGDDIKGSWVYTNNKTYVEYTFTNYSSKWILMTAVGLWTASEQEVIREKIKVYVKPYGVESTRFYVGDLNLDVVKQGFRSCRYEDPSKVSNTNNSNNSLNKKSNNSSSNNWGRKKSNDSGSSLFGLLAAFLVVGGIAMMISKNSSSKTRSRSTPKTYTENYKETYPETDNSDSSEIMPKPEIQRRYKIIAKFYNNYKFIDYGKIKNKKIAQKQMEDIVNVVDKNLSEISAGTANTPYRMLIVGMVTFKLLSTNQIKKVHKDLGKMYELGQRLQFDDRLMNALRNILDDNAGIDY
jgi:hypothetical protein